MKLKAVLPCTLVVVLWTSLVVRSESVKPTANEVSYVREIRPFLSKYCLECHNASKASSGLNVESYRSLREGGNGGPAIEPGRPDESLLLLLVERKQQPHMPPRNYRVQPKPEEIARLRAWIAAGAKDDSGSTPMALPELRPKTDRPAPVTAIAYDPKGRWLAAGVGHEVRLWTLPELKPLARIPTPHVKVTALAFNPSGSYLAVAASTPGVSGEIRLHFVPPSGVPALKPDTIIEAHPEQVLGLAYSPDGQWLASCGYDRLVKLWRSPSGEAVATLKDHSDAVYAVAWAPHGKLLASAGADRAVKIWDTSSGKRLYTLSEATDWVYTVTWHPDGRRLAAGGVDRSIRVWEALPEGGRLIHSVFAHEGAVLRLVYSADGKLLISLGEDRVVKIWDAQKMTEVRALPAQPESVLALAVRPDSKQLALGRFDGALLLVDVNTGNVQAQPLPTKPPAPKVSRLIPQGVIRGQSNTLTVEGEDLDAVTSATLNVPNSKVELLPTPNPRQRNVRVEIPNSALAGTYQLTLQAPGGSAQATVFVDYFASSEEVEPNNSARTAPLITLPRSITASLDRAGEVDFYRFQVQAGDQIGVQVIAEPGASLEPVLLLTDEQGQLLVESFDGLLGYRFAQAGTYALAVHDRQYRGDGKTRYRLHIGPIAVITGIYPLGLQRGTETTVHLFGVHLGHPATVKIAGKPDQAIGSRLPVALSTSQGPALGNRSVVIGEFPEVVAPWETLQKAGETELGSVPVPGVANGCLFRPSDTHLWQFSARRGQRLIVEVEARRLGSPLDSVVEILDARRQPVPRAVLRCVARTFTTFRDHDNVSAGIRLEDWRELAVNDYVYINGELLRILALPRNPDDDCRFFNVNNQRLGYLDTTPIYHPPGTPVYKVEIHPPGSSFSPNGYPIIPLFYRNDDGGPGYGKDSRIIFDPPADGTYYVRIGEASGITLKESQHAARETAPMPYRLIVRPPRPDFRIRFEPREPRIERGGATPINFTVDRVDGFDGRVDVELVNLPPGLSAPPTHIGPEEFTTAVALYAEPDAKLPEKPQPLKAVARARMGDQVIVREFVAGIPSLIEPGDIRTTTREDTITIRPGGETKLTVRIERRNDFKGRVPIDVIGLPHGVRVLDVGLNGILITPNETERTISIYCEPWVVPMEHPFVVFARREGKNTVHAAKSVLLRVVAPEDSTASPR
ncbi:MAG: c-type cytochrome domain-containing protein [Gemmatales bacterium]|nr:c-type cytochrome domain-containing protein [Gemmatales bacterium]